MRKPAILLIAAFAAACSSDIAAPIDPLDSFDTGAIVAYDAAGMSGPGRYLTMLHRLPEDLKLTADQAAAIRALLDAFRAANQDDISALAAIHAEAAAARRAGKSREEIAAILARGNEIRRRLMEAEQRLEAAIADVLTAEQKAWLASHHPQRCDRRTAPPLTEVQATQIRALIAAYEETNKADLEAVKAALERARAAQQSGA
ncbi:MAG TPA: Spy/CpxP family protein refolding chaperone, partial [Longimicrobiales bacterium]|nr:Spy/CpxP family protein refolding chaperone [Longimicrobiales bacterium]